MSIFKRLGLVFKAEAHSAIDKIEDPVKMTEQGIREMKEDLKKAIEAIAQVKATNVRFLNEANNYKKKAEEYEKKAIALLQSAQEGKIAQAEADRLAAAALQEKNKYLQSYQQAMQNYKATKAQEDKLDASIKKLRANIRQWENELKLLKARSKVADATVKVNKQLSGIDSSDTVAMLERMKEKVEDKEALSQAYQDMALEETSITNEIDSAIQDLGADTSSELEALKAKLSGGLPPTDAPSEESGESQNA